METCELCHAVETENTETGEMEPPVPVTLYANGEMTMTELCSSCRRTLHRFGVEVLVMEEA